MSKLKNILDDYKIGNISQKDVLQYLNKESIESLEFANIDHERELRKGFPEVIFGEGKSNEQVVEIAIKIYNKSDRLLITRSNQECFTILKNDISNLVYFPDSKVITTKNTIIKGQESDPEISIVTGGTSDIKYAEEAKVTINSFGYGVKTFYDVGVAGLNRLLKKMPEISNSKVIIVAAGMEGALVSVVSGLVQVPIIALPTSIGYGSSFNGITALLAMLNSCSPGITVVNIDNGFGAGYAAAQIIRLTKS